MVRKNLGINELALAVALGITPIAGCTQQIIREEQDQQQAAALHAIIDETYIEAAAESENSSMRKLEQIADAIYTYDVNVFGLKLMGIPLHELTPATSWFSIRKTNEAFRFREYPQLNNRLAQLIKAEQAMALGKGYPLDIYILENETKLRPGYKFGYNLAEPVIRQLLSKTSNVSYQKSIELAVMTEHGLRPIIAVHNLTKDGKKMLYVEWFDRTSDEYERDELNTRKILVARTHISPDKMQYILGPLTLRYKLGRTEFDYNNHADLIIGYMVQNGAATPVVLSLQNSADAKLATATAIFSEYAGIKEDTVLSAEFYNDMERRRYISGPDRSLSVIIDGTTAEFAPNH